MPRTPEEIKYYTERLNQHDPTRKATYNPQTEKFEMRDQFGGGYNADWEMVSGFGPMPTSALPSLKSDSIVTSPIAEENDAINQTKSRIDQTKQMLGMNGLQNDIMNSYNNVVNKILNPGEMTDGPSMQDLETQQKDINTITDIDEQRIKNAGLQAGSKFDPLIQGAKERSVQGRASNISAAAKSGGLDTSAWVGISALVGKELAGEGFEGVGGKLAQMGSEYDAQIANLESQKRQAIAAAEAAERTAIITGKRDSFNDALKLYDRARDAFEKQQSLLLNQEQVLRQYATQVKDQMKEVRDEIKRMASSGIDLTELTPEEITLLEQEAGFTPGTFEAQYNSYFDEFMAEQEKAMLDRGIKLTNVAKDLEEGKEYQIPGTDIIVKGLKQDDPTVSEMDVLVGGRTFRIGIDKQTGEELWRIDTGKVKSNNSSGSKFPQAFSAWYEMTFGEKPQRGDDAAEAEYTRWSASGGATGVKNREAEIENPGKYTPQEVRKLRNANIDPKDIKKADAFLYNKKNQNSPFQALIEQRKTERQSK